MLSGSKMEEFSPIRIGITGSIGMGKSTITKQLLKLGFPVFDADKAVHHLYSENGDAVEPIRSVFPSAIVDNTVSRPDLMKIIMSDPNALQQVEKIVHPLVIAQRRSFYDKAIARKSLFVIYDIPLLYEKFDQYKDEVDYVIVVSCDEHTQRNRVMNRPGMTMEKFQNILSRQVSDEYKRSHADYVIYTNYAGYSEGRHQLAHVIQDIVLNKEAERFKLWKETHTYKYTRPSIHLFNTRDSIQFDAVVFDLDETLSQMRPTIRFANEQLLDVVRKKMPVTYQKYGPNFIDLLKVEMARVKKENPLIAHDLSEVRRIAILAMITPMQEADFIEELMQTFLTARSQITPHLFSDTIPCLQYLQSLSLPMGILSNGNCDFQRDQERDGIGSFFQWTLSAVDVGDSKPGLMGFLACIQLLGNLPPQRILFVGDDLDRDGLGARRAGMKTALLVRDVAEYQRLLEDPEPQQYDFLLNNLTPEHLHSVLKLPE